jgi:hypothetical protein
MQLTSKCIVENVVLRACLCEILIKILVIFFAEIDPAILFDCKKPAILAEIPR